MKDKVSDENNIDRLLHAVLNHHVLIEAVKQKSDWMQAIIDSIKITDPNWIELLFEFARENYIKHRGVQERSKSDECTYVTYSINSLLFYQFVREKNLSEEKFNSFLFNAKNKDIESFDINFSG